MMKNYNNLINELLIDVKNFPDNECLELSTKSESEYILQHAQRIRYTIQYFINILQKKNYIERKCKILDIGTTPFTFLYNKYFDAQIYSIDLTNLLERRCKLNNVIFRKCNLLEEDIPFPDNEFDIIIFTEVFEHLIGPPQLIFNRIRKVLNDNGMLIFSTPNIARYYNRLMLLFGKSILSPIYEVFKEEIQGNWVHGSGHWREFTMEELKDLLSRYQFKVIKSKHIIKSYEDIKTINPFKFIKRLGMNIYVSMLPASQFNLILTQKK